MSNIAVVPRFQKPWALKYALDSAGTCNYPGLLDNTATLFTLGLPPTGLILQCPQRHWLLLLDAAFLPGLLPLYYPTVYFRFVGNSTKDQGPGSKSSPLLCSFIMPFHNKATL